MSRAPRELVLASAGAGKTFRISSRIIGLLAYGEPPASILAASFTRKAAGEILRRVLVRLAHAALQPKAAAELARHSAFDGGAALPDDPAFWASILETVVDNLDRFEVGTLDAFFIRTARAFGNDLGFPPVWGIASSLDYERLRSDTVLHTLRLGDRREVAELLRHSGRGFPRRSVHYRVFGMIEELLSIQAELDPQRDDPWRALHRLPAPGPARDPGEIRAAVDAMELPKTKSTGEPNKTWVKAQERVLELLDSHDWEELSKQKLLQRVIEGNFKYSTAEMALPVIEAIQDVIDLCRAELWQRLGTEIAAIQTLTERLDTGYTELQARSGHYSFTDVTRRIGTLQGTQLLDLFYRLDASVRHILLDEFQDTSLAQWEALSPLFEEIVSDDSRVAVVVADPKQSIYGWRGAEPATVHRIAKHYSLGQDHLATSYRSSATVLEFVNRIFGSIDRNEVWKRDRAYEVAAEEWIRDFRPHRTDLTTPGYVRIEVGPEDEGEGRRRPNLYRRTARRVQQLSQTRPGYSIGILARTNDVVAELYMQLRQLGLEVSQEGGNPLTDSGVCEAILALLKLADHPGDTIARYHVSQTPIGAIYGLRSHTEHMTAELVARRVRRQLADMGYGGFISDLAQKVVGRCDRRDARRLFQLTELAHGYDERATLRPADFVRLVEAERVEDPTTANIRVMTIHQAKGLEFDIVVLPQLDETDRARIPPALAHREDRAGRITGVYPYARKDVRKLFEGLDDVEVDWRVSLARDSLSTLYVALTRARYALELIIAPDRESGSGTATTPARIIRWALFGEDLEEHPARPGETLYETGDPDWHTRPGARPERDSAETDEAVPIPALSLKSGRRQRILPRQRPSDLHGDAIQLRDYLRVDTADALDRGSIAHAWFEQIEWLDDGPPARDELRRAARQAIPEVTEARIEELLGDFDGWLTAPAIRAILQRSRYPSGASLRVERELPFLRRYNDGLMEGAIDRVVLTLDGERVVAAEVIDYKTDQIPEGRSHVETARRYREQLSAYVDAVCELYGVSKDVCSATLVLLQHGETLEVELG